jgi:hypothetical protein
MQVLTIQHRKPHQLVETPISLILLSYKHSILVKTEANLHHRRHAKGEGGGLWWFPHFLSNGLGTAALFTIVQPVIALVTRFSYHVAHASRNINQGGIAGSGLQSQSWAHTR